MYACRVSSIIGAHTAVAGADGRRRVQKWVLLALAFGLREASNSSGRMS